MKVAERYLWLAPLMASVVVLLSAAAVAERSIPLATTTALFWGKWLLLVSVATCLGLFALGWLLQVIIKRPAGRGVLWLLGLSFLFSVLVRNWGPSLFLLTLGEAPPGGGMSGIAFGLCLLAVVANIVSSQRWRWLSRGLSVMALMCFVVWIWPRQAEEVAASLPPVEPTGQRLLVIGIDGASWEYLDPLIGSGQVPNIQRLVEGGLRGPLKTIRPTRSPALWTTMVTGKRPRAHGILGHSVMRPKGGHHTLPEAKALARGFGLKRLEAELTDRGQIVLSPATSVERRVPAFWNITTAYESPLDVVNWWASWPAEGILGRMVTDRTYFWRWAVRGFGDVEEAITFPDSLYRELAPLVMRPDQVTLESAREFMDIDAEQFTAMQEAGYRHHEILSEFKYYYSMFESHRRIAKYLLEKARARDQVPSDLMVIFRLVDVTSHSSLQFSELVEDHLDSTPEDLRRFGSVVTESYRSVDRAIGELLELFGEGNVVLISDHGFLLEGKGRKRHYEHRKGPVGIFLGSGPAFGTGDVDGLSIFDVLPILLGVKGFPVAEDLVTGVPVRVFDAGFLSRYPITKIDTFGTLARDRPVSESAVDDEMMKRLEALGYLD